MSEQNNTTSARERVKQELDTVQKNLAKLTDFIGSEAYANLHPLKQMLLTRQQEIMLDFASCLTARLSLWDLPDKQ